MCDIDQWTGSDGVVNLHQDPLSGARQDPPRCIWVRDLRIETLQLGETDCRVHVTHVPTGLTAVARGTLGAVCPFHRHHATTRDCVRMDALRQLVRRVFAEGPPPSPPLTYRPSEVQ